MALGKLLRQRLLAHPLAALEPLISSPPLSVESCLGRLTQHTCQEPPTRAGSGHSEGGSLGELAVLPGRGRSSHSPQAHGLGQRDIRSADGLVGVSKHPPQLTAS
ncbi:unnamed protein product [Rangifer tarandus platyrhynchus]|uniref:Uncharacterized protein n=1 Tax=Rangifer tarandus platyrhynchus TaxID=3082113 RepID=A0AC59Z9G1_RANTA